MASLNKQLCGFISAVSLAPALALSADDGAMPAVDGRIGAVESKTSAVTDAFVLDQLRDWYPGSAISWGASATREVTVTLDLDRFDEYITVPSEEGQTKVFNLGHNVPCWIKII